MPMAKPTTRHFEGNRAQAAPALSNRREVFVLRFTREEGVEGLGLAVPCLVMRDGSWRSGC